MQIQINIPVQSMFRVIPEEGIAKTLQQNNPKILNRARNDMRMKD
ncbi:MAG: hypothetical protein ACYDA4_16180 [Ignavibacteriaceae bacterium]